jgi:hypothetical protein
MTFWFMGFLLSNSARLIPSITLHPLNGSCNFLNADEGVRKP